MFLYWKCYSSLEKFQLSKITFEQCVGFHAEFSKVHTVHGVFLEVNGNIPLNISESSSSEFLRVKPFKEYTVLQVIVHRTRLKKDFNMSH